MIESCSKVIATYHDSIIKEVSMNKKIARFGANLLIAAITCGAFLALCGVMDHGFI